MSSWVARVEWRSPDAFSDDAIDFILDGLTGHSAVLSGEEPGTWSVTLSVQAGSLAEATAEAIALVAGATGETMTGIEVLLENVFDERAAGIKV